MTERAREQLASIAEVHGLFEGKGIEHWLFGGWAVDFHASSVTRAHDDVDLAVWVDDLTSIGSLLERTGWRHAPDPDEDGGTGYERGLVRLELTFLVRRPDGSVRVPLRQREVRWLEQRPGRELRELSGAACRVVGLASLITSKASPRDDPGEGAKDRADLAVLRSVQSRNRAAQLDCR